MAPSSGAGLVTPSFLYLSLSLTSQNPQPRGHSGEAEAGSHCLQNHKVRMGGPWGGSWLWGLWGRGRPRVGGQSGWLGMG